MIAIAAFALLAALPQDAPLVPMTEQEILVVGQRLNSLAVNVGRDAKGRWYCGLTESTGYPKLDDRLCRAATRCVRKGTTDVAGVNACIAKAKPGLLAELRKRIKRGDK